MNKMLVKLTVVFSTLFSSMSADNPYDNLIKKARQYVFQERKETEPFFQKIVEDKNQRVADYNRIDSAYEGLLDTEDARGIFVEYMIAGIENSSSDMMQEVRDNITTQYATLSDNIDGRDMFYCANEHQLAAICALVEEYNSRKLREELEKLPNLYTESGFCAASTDEHSQS